MDQAEQKEPSETLTRRTFLESAALGGTALLASQIAPIAAYGRNFFPLQPSTGHHEDQRRDVLSLSPLGSVTIQGWIGNRIELCVNNRVMAQSVSDLIEPYRSHADGDGGFRGEFWGKWFTSACLGYAIQPTPKNREILDKAVSELLATQSENGHIGTYDEKHQLTNWDIWSRKYVLLGLIAYHDTTGSADALLAAGREADYLISQVGPGKSDIAETCLGVLKGLPSSSILEPMVLLYNRTREPRYLDFANYIVGSWSVPNKSIPRGMRLIEDAIAGVPPQKIDSPKGYEMMSCFEGLCELYRVTGNDRYREAAVQFGTSILGTELMVDGSCSNQELWCNGTISQTSNLEQPQETCVTATWMKFCCQLLRLTSDSQWADQMEISLYNALTGAMMPEGDWWAYFSPLTGQRVPSNIQYFHLSCCVANGPRALLLTPQWAVMQSARGPVINLYASGIAQCALPDGSAVTLRQETEYPVASQIAISVDPAKSSHFELSLRIPAWSRETTLSVNGTPVKCEAGQYARITRIWSAGDSVQLNLDLSGRAVPAPSGAPQFAVMRGPVLLALDSRFVAPEETDVHLLVTEGSRVSLTPAKDKSDEVWMAFEVPFEVRPSHFFGHHEIRLTMVDFASAGNKWSDDNLFRTWLPQPLFLADAYPAHTWKVMYPDSAMRPGKPST